MKRITIILFLVFSFISQYSFAIVAGGMISVNRSWTANANYQNLEFSMKIKDAGSNTSHFYWANQFWFQNGDGGYAGLQNRGNGVRAINFSVWGINNFDRNSGVANCRKFGHEGSGIQCDYIYNWEEGLNYVFKLNKNGDSLTLVVEEETTRLNMVFATLYLPVEWGGFSHSTNGFVEEYSQGNQQLNSCTDVSNTEADFGATYLDGQEPQSSTTRTYGNCASVADSICVNNQKCLTKTGVEYILSDNQENPFSNLINPYFNYCLDTLGGDINHIGVWNCGPTNNPNQLWKYNIDSHTISRIGQPLNKCLTYDDNNRTKLGACDSRSEWWYQPSDKSFLNINSQKCLEIAQGGNEGSYTQVYDCLNNGYQKWEFSP